MYVSERYTYTILFSADASFGIVWETMEKKMVRTKGIPIKHDRIKIKS